MLGWLKSIWNLITGVGADIWHAVVSALTAVYSFVDKEYHVMYSYVIRTADDLIHSIAVLGDTITHVYGYIIHWAESEFSNIAKWAVSEFNALYHDIIGLLQWTAGQLDSLMSELGRMVNDIVSWVVRAVWDPLYGWIHWLIGWVTKYGYYVYKIITHPELLASILISYLFAFWLKLLAKYARPVIVYMMAHWKGIVPDLVRIAEDIISTLFLRRQWYD